MDAADHGGAGLDAQVPNLPQLRRATAARTPTPSSQNRVGEL